MTRSEVDRRQVTERAKEIYERQIRAQVERDHLGEFVVIDVDSGEFEVDRDKIAAADRLKARRPKANLFISRVGYPTAASVGGPLRSRHP